MWWVQAAQSWLPTIAVAVMTVLALFAALAQAPRAAKLGWITAVVLCGAVAIAAAAWQQSQELAQLRDLSSHLGALARLLPGGTPASPEETVDSLATSLASLNARIDELQHQIEALREKSRGRAIDAMVIDQDDMEDAGVILQQQPFQRRLDHVGLIPCRHHGDDSRPVHRFGAYPG